MSIGQQIKQQRENLKMTQEELAGKLNVSRQAVSKWESDLSIPTYENQKDIMEILGIDFLKPVTVVRLLLRQKILLISGWTILVIVSFLLIFVLSSREATLLVENSTKDISYYDHSGKQLALDANWYVMDADTTLIVTYEGIAPESVSAYFTPAGTETLDQRQQLAIVPIRDDKNYALVHLNFSSEIIGYLQISLDYGATSLISEYFNIYYEK